MRVGVFNIVASRRDGLSLWCLVINLSWGADQVRIGYLYLLLCPGQHLHTVLRWNPMSARPAMFTHFVVKPHQIREMRCCAGYDDATHLTLLIVCTIYHHVSWISQRLYNIVSVNDTNVNLAVADAHFLCTGHQQLQSSGAFLWCTFGRLWSLWPWLPVYLRTKWKLKS